MVKIANLAQIVNVIAPNSFEQPDVVQARPFTEVKIAQGVASAELGPLSVAALTFKL